MEEFWNCGSNSNLPDFDSLGAAATRRYVFDVNYPSSFPLGYSENFCARYTGQVYAPSAGGVGFSLTSDDGSKLWVNGDLVVNNDGLHEMVTKTGTVSAAAG